MDESTINDRQRIAASRNTSKRRNNQPPGKKEYIGRWDEAIPKSGYKTKKTISTKLLEKTTINNKRTRRRNQRIQRNKKEKKLQVSSF
jgi:hypothetical protein